jgi:hypothetical protein
LRNIALTQKGFEEFLIRDETDILPCTTTSAIYTDMDLSETDSAKTNHLMPQCKFDAHEKPPVVFREAFKRFQRIKNSELESDPNVIDFNRIGKQNASIRQVGFLQKERILQSCLCIEREEQVRVKNPLLQDISDSPIYELDKLRGKD